MAGITSTGLVANSSTASGATFSTWSMMVSVIFRFCCSSSSRVWPGLRLAPAVMTTTEAPARSA